MESLQLTYITSYKLSANISTKVCSFRPSRRLSFLHSGHRLRKSFRNGRLTVVRSDLTGNGGEFDGLADGSNSNPDAVEGEEGEEMEKQDVMLGKDRDDSGSVITLHLIPPSGEVAIDSHQDEVVAEPKHEDEGVEEEKIQTKVTYNIVFVTAEAAPYSKTGGLGDVCGSLPVVLAGRGHRVMVVSPRYLNGTSADKNFASAIDLDRRITVHCFGGEQEVAFFHEYKKGVDWGVEPASTYMNLGLPLEWYGAMEWVFPTWARTHALDPGEAVNVLKGAIVTADRILTVSKGYAWEITTVEGGYGLNELLSSRRIVLNGIVNGIDVSEWDPSSDEHIGFHYSADDLSGKAQCKLALQKELGLPIKPECPMIGFIGRLDYQKGIDLIRSGIPELFEDDVQFVMLGSGDPQYEDWMRAAETIYRDKFRGWVGFNIPISHRITAGCDILLMPSRYEPCGLNQLYAMRYGTVPVVHATGGLRDTVENFSPYAGDGSGEGTGWTFSPLTKESMLEALRTAIMTYRDHKSTWEALMRRGMLRDFTWETAAIQYEQVFEWTCNNPPYIP